MATAPPHGFQPGPDSVPDSLGRPMHLCRVCGRNGRGSGHRPTPDRPRARKVHAPAAKPLDPVLAALVAILDVVRAAEVLPMAAHVHAVALRAILVEGSGTRLTGPSMVEAGPAPDLQVVGRTYHADVDATVARARAATKGIRNDRMRALATRAVAQGWSPRPDGNGHLRLERPGHRPIVLSMTVTGDARSWRNARAAAKRKGLDVTGL